LALFLVGLPALDFGVCKFVIILDSLTSNYNNHYNY